MLEKEIHEWNSSIKNDFEDSLLNKYATIKKIKDQLYQLGANYAAMTGSGSTVFGIFENKIDVDGYIGPATLKACKNLEPDRLRAYRVLKFAGIVNKKPTQEKYWYGWYKRALRV